MRARFDTLFGRLFGVLLLAIILAHLLAFAWFHHYGPPPPPNSTAVKVLAALWLAVILISIIAAIAVPAYMGYADAGL